jgi:hypothetical protein
LRARDTAVLGAALIAYDFVATARLPLMADLFAHLAGLPLAPIVAWPAGEGGWLGIGVGDLLLATVFPLAMRKAFGRAAGLAALALAGVALTAVLMSSVVGAPGEVFPVMVVLGPLLVAQYIYWRRRQGPERTTHAYLEAEPLGSRAGTPSSAGPQHHRPPVSARSAGVEQLV